MARVAPVAALVFALAALLTACGTDDDASTSVVRASPTPTATATPAPGSTPAPTTTAEPTPGADEPAAVDGDATPTPALGLDRPAFTADSKLTTVGLDEVFFGLTPADAAERADTAWLGIPTPPQVCYEITPVNGPEGITFTVLNGFIERVDITTDLITTRSGAGIGTTEAELEAMFPGNLFPVAIEGGGNRIQFVSTDEDDREFRIVFVTDGTKVTEMQAGRVPLVLDGCPS